MRRRRDSQADNYWLAAQREVLGASLGENGGARSKPKRAVRKKRPLQQKRCPSNGRTSPARASQLRGRCYLRGCTTNFGQRDRYRGSGRPKMESHSFLAGWATERSPNETLSPGNCAANCLCRACRSSCVLGNKDPRGIKLSRLAESQASLAGWRFSMKRGEHGCHFWFGG